MSSMCSFEKLHFKIRLFKFSLEKSITAIISTRLIYIRLQYSILKMLINDPICYKLYNLVDFQDTNSLNSSKQIDFVVIF